MEVPPWLSWQSVRLLTDRSSVRSREGAFFCWCTIIQMDDEQAELLHKYMFFSFISSRAIT